MALWNQRPKPFRLGHTCLHVVLDWTSSAKQYVRHQLSRDADRMLHHNCLFWKVLVENFSFSGMMEAWM